ncbi:MAG: BPSS1780 family membrane protein [Betaproteobacteria bacterium]|nr:BPSS1780 family membrane protein [Betaproteobacteria bacterium]
MQARVVAAKRGARWLAEGWRLFRVSPPVWIALVFGYWLVMSALSLVPLVGVAAATVLIPAFAVGFMTASRSCERGQAPELPQLLAGFRERVATQLGLGAVYLGCLAALLAASALADHGALARWMIEGQRPDDEMLQSNAFSLALMSAAVLYVPVMMMFWFAPVLAAWHGLGAAKALFFSFFATLINWRAFLVYAAVAGLVTVAIPFALLLGLSLVLGTQPFTLTAVVFLMLVILLPTLLASFYASYRDVFAPPAES